MCLQRFFKSTSSSLLRYRTFTSSPTGLPSFDYLAQIIRSKNSPGAIKQALDLVNLAQPPYDDLLHIATEVSSLNQGNTDFLRYMLANKGVGVTGINKKFSQDPVMNPTPLGIAVMHGRLKIAALLLSYHADPNVPFDIKGDTFHRRVTPLHLAAVAGDDKMAALLIKHHAIVDPTNEAGETPLLLTCWKGYADVMSLLLENDANPYATNRIGRFPTCHTTPMDFIKRDPTLYAKYLSTKQACRVSFQ